MKVTDVPVRNCPDGGACHHGCLTGPCWRVANAAPLSGVYSGDAWPAELNPPSAQENPDEDEALDPDLEQTLEALSVPMAALLSKVQSARDIAVALEQECDEARRLLAGLLTLVRPSSWAADTHLIEQARAFLDQADDD